MNTNMNMNMVDTTPTFVSGFSGVTATLRTSTFAPRAKLCCATPRSRHSARAVLGVQKSTSTSGVYGAPTTPQTYEVKVIQSNKCTVIQVDRDTNLRKALLDNKVDVYTLKGKLTNCGGGGQCGTCLIAVESGYTNGRTPREEFLLKGKPDDWRLACRTMINGDVTIRTKPQ